MKSFFEDLESQLRAAARARTKAGAGADSPQRAGRTWLRSGVRATPVLVAVVTTVAIAVAALLLLGHRHRPAPSSASSGANRSTLAWIFGSTPTARLHRELSYINVATQRTQQAHPRLCSPRLPPRTSFIHGSVSSALLSSLGVLRRPQTRADRRGKQSLSGVPDVYLASIRRAFVADGVSYFVAVARSDPSAFQPSPRCFAFQVSALHAELPNIPRSLRKATATLQSTLIAFDRRTIYGGPRQTLCVDTIARNSGGSECGLTLTEILHGMTPSDDNGTFNGIVPDGVATVTILWRTPHTAQQSVTTAVHGNMYAVRGRIPNNPLNLAVTVVWRSAQGQVVKTLSQPSPAAAERYCRRHRTACLGAAGGAGLVLQGSSSSSSGSGFSGTQYAPAQVSSSSSSSSATTPSGAAPPPTAGVGTSATATTASSSSSGG